VALLWLELKQGVHLFLPAAALSDRRRKTPVYDTAFDRTNKFKNSFLLCVS